MTSNPVTKPGANSEVPYDKVRPFDPHFIVDVPNGRYLFDLEYADALRIAFATGADLEGTVVELRAAYLHRIELVTPPDESPAPTTQIPTELPQPTFPELKIVARAFTTGLTDAPWLVADELVFTSTVADASHTVSVDGTRLQSAIQSTDADSLFQQIRGVGIQGVSVLYLCIALLVKHEDVVLDVDEVIEAIGWDPRTRHARIEMRREVLAWLDLFSATTVFGRRHKVFWSRGVQSAKRKPLDLLSRDPLLVILGSESDSAARTMSVHLTAGDWLRRVRMYPHVVTSFPGLLNIARIPSGQPSGCWAKSIGFALNQRWREAAYRTKIGHAGDMNHRSARTPHYTRMDLLGMFPATPWVEEVLASPNPRRAKAYFQTAMRILKGPDVGVVSHFAEVDSVAPHGRSFYGHWLHDQRLDIRPGRAGTDAIAAIAATRKKRVR